MASFCALEQFSMSKTEQWQVRVIGILIFNNTFVCTRIQRTYIFSLWMNTPVLTVQPLWTDAENKRISPVWSDRIFFLDLHMGSRVIIARGGLQHVLHLLWTNLLWIELLHEWCNLPLDQLDFLVFSMLRRCIVCVALHGKHIACNI